MYGNNSKIRNNDSLGCGGCARLILIILGAIVLITWMLDWFLG